MRQQIRLGVFPTIYLKLYYIPVQIINILGLSNAGTRYNSSYTKFCSKIWLIRWY